MNKLFEYIIGYTEFEIACMDIAKFITECAKNKINLHNIKKSDKYLLKFRVHNYQSDNILKISEKYALSCKIVKSKSLILLINKALKRKFFLIGFAVFVVVIICSTSFISDIDIEGNERLSDEQIKLMLEECGFKKGIFAFNIDKKKIQQEMIKNYNEFSWLWIDIKGTVANVTVKEKIHKPEIIDFYDYSNCIASNDAQIIEVMPRYGRQMVYPGDVVKKGDLLISGISETKTAKIRYIHADGIVMAKTWYSISGEYHHTRCDRYLTGNSKKRYNINIFGNEFPLSFGKQMYEKYDKDKKVKKLSQFLNLSFTISTYYEIMEKNVEIGDDEVVKTAVESLKAELYKNLESKKDLTVNNITYDYYINETGNVVVTVNFECVEDIAQYKQLEKPDYFTEDVDGKNNNV